jgi:chitodextrinase
MWGAAPYNRRVVLLLGLFAAIVLGCVQGAGAVLTPAGSSGAGATSPQTTVDSQAPTSPSNLTVTAVTTSSISLSWSTATDNVGVTGYGRYLSGYLVNSGTLTRFTWTGLKCGTNYALAVDATDAAGNRSAPASLTGSTTSCGPDTTSPSPVGNLQLSSATQTTIALGWLPATDNVGVAGYNLYVNGTKVGSTTNTSYTFTGLACGTAYSLAIETFDAAGNVSNRSLTTTSQSTTPCDQPTTPTGPAVLVGNATIEAQADSSPAGEAEAGVTTAASTGQVNELRVYVDTPTTATSVKVGIYADAAGKPGARLSSGTITTPQKGTWNAAPIAPVSVSAGKQYWIAVLGIGGAVAYRDRCCGSGTPVQTNAGVLTELPATWTTGPYIGNAGPLSAYGTWNAATSPAPAPPAPAPPSPTDTTPPTAPSGLSVSGGTATSLTLSWTASSDNVGVTGYGRYKNGTLLSTTSGTSYTFTGLTCGTTYTLAVDATDAAGNRSTKAQTTAATTTCGDTQAPSTPTGLAVAAATPGSISISWAAATDNVAVIGYGHYQNGSLVSTSSGTGYTFSGLSCGTGYTLSVDATDAAGNRSTRAQITASTSPCATGPLVGDATVGPQADSSAAGEAEAAVTTAGASGQINELLVYLAPSNAAPTVKIGLYADAVGRPGALLASGTVASVKNGAWNVASIAPVPVTAGKQYWIAVLGIGGTIAYRDRCCGSGTPVQTAAGVLAAMPSVWTTGSYTGNDGPFSAYGDWTGSAPPPTPSPDTAPPSTPTGLLVSNAAQTTVTLSWTAASDNVAVTSYGHYRNAGLVDSGSATSYAFGGLTCGTSYTLGVDAADAAGNRSSRAQVTVATGACTPPSGSANVYMSPSGSDANPCSQGQPCRTFDRAYRVASSGATVEVAGGSYPGQTINPDNSKTSTSDVIFRPASGASVTVTGEIEANGAHFELRDMTIDQINFPRSADDITLRNVINHGMWMQGPSNISIIGGEITCATCNYHSHIQNGGSDSRPPTNILFDGVYFHDWQSQAGEHTECLQILGGDRVTIRNSTFKNCATANGGLGATADLHISSYGTGPVTRNILIENNFFFRSGNTYAIQSGDYSNLDFRYNSIVGPILVGGGWGDGTPVEFVGNIMGFGNCQAPVTGAGPVAPFVYRYNTLQGGTCSTTDKNAAAGFIDATNNLHLATGAAAVNAGDSTNYPATDIDGQARPMGSAPDAGADETDTAPIALPPTNSPPPSDTTPPSPVSGLQVSATTQTSVTYAWNPATDNVAVSGYNMLRGGIMVGSTSALSYTYNGLICGTAYTFAVQTYDSSGNTSDPALATNVASTSPCSGSGDTTAPTAPGNLAATAATSTSISAAWTASTDNVGVAGYGRYVNGVLVSSGPGTSYTFSGLNCATGYTLAADAYDAAGNRSGKTQITASTGACSTAPSNGAANLWVDANGGTCTRSAAPVSYSDAAACSSFDKAWDAASAGDTIRVKNGTYGIQHVSGNKTSETFIIGESKAGVVVSGAAQDCYPVVAASTMFCADATHMTLEDVTIDAGSNDGAAPGSLINADDVTYRNVDILGDWPDLYLGNDATGGGGNRFHWDGGTWGDANPPPRDCSTPHGEIIWDDGVTGVTIEGVTFNKQTTAVGAGPYCGADNVPHLEFVRLEPNSDNFTLRNNVYMPGSEAGSGYIFVNNATTDNVKIIGNYFADNDSPNYWIQAGDSPCNWTIAYNTFSGNDGAYLGCTAITWIGNLGPANSYPGCSGTHIENVWQTAGSCGTDSFTSGSLGVGAVGHLQAGSIAIDAAGTTQCQSLTDGVDIDGRPRTGTCDAGADEFGN